MTIPTLEEGMRLARRLQRQRLRRYGPITGRVDLPELDDLELRTLLPTSPRPPARPIDRERSAVDWYAPDGTVIDLPFPDNVRLAESLMTSEERIVARSTRYRHGVRLWISTVFLGTDHNYSGVGPPLLYETMIFHGGTRGPGNGIECWRYSARDAALAGHRRIVHILDTTRWPRRRALAARVARTITGTTSADGVAAAATRRTMGA